MTIQTVQKPLPDQFCLSKIFLDDLEEIVAILRDLIRKVEGKNLEDTTLTITCFGRQCTTLEEIPKILKPRREVEVKVECRPYSTTMKFHPQSGARWYASPFLKTEEVLTAYHQLNPIFERRKRKILAFVNSASARALYIFLGPALMGGGLLLERSKDPTYKRLGLVGLFVLFGLFLLLMADLIAPRRIIFARNSYEPSQLRQLLVDKNLPWPLGIIAGIAVTLLTQFLIHRIWPKP